MANDNDVQLEGYRDLSKWNDRDIQTVITFRQDFPSCINGGVSAIISQRTTNLSICLWGQRFVLIVLANSIPPV